MPHTVEWYDPANDPAVIQLAKSVRQRARWALPDVMIEQDQLLAELAELIPLFQQRIAHRTQAATQATAPDVEFVVTRAKTTQTDAYHEPPAGPSALDETRASRTRAERVETARLTLDAAERVRTATDTHALEVNALRKAAIDAMHHLHVTFQHHHRFAGRFTFSLPTSLDVDHAVYEVGLSRVLDALTPNLTQTEEEGAA